MPMEEEKLMEDEAKKKKRRDRHRSVGGGGSKISAHTLKLSPKLSQLNQTKLTRSTQKKKKKKIFFKVFRYLSKSKFSIQNFHSQIFNSNLQFSKKFKPHISWSKFQALIFKILRLKISDFKKKFLSSKVSKFEIKISKFPSFKNLMFLKRKIFCQLNFSW